MLRCMGAYSEMSKKVLAVLQDRFSKLDDIKGTSVTVVSKDSNGKQVIVELGVKHRVYSSDYWKNQKNGEYLIYMTQGGIRNRDIPKDEKKDLLNFLSRHLCISEDIDAKFSGTLRLYVYEGVIASILVEYK